MALKPFSWVVNRLRELAQEQPDRLEGCYYLVEGEPACIVGHVLDELGVPMDVRLCVEGVGAGDLPWPNLGVRSPGLRQKWWIDRLQLRQDNGASWSAALAAADRETEIL